MAYWEGIPMGKEDRPVLVYDSSAPLAYDITDTNGDWYMLKPEFLGCMVLPFSKRMSGQEGLVEFEGKPVNYVLETMAVQGMESWWLGVRLGGHITRYGQEGTLRISGFTDTDGNRMEPAEIRVKAGERVQPLPEYAAREAVALQAAREGIVLLKNDRGILPLKKDARINIFGKGIYEFRFCAVGAGKINPRYEVGLLEALREQSDFQLNRELLEFYSHGRDSVPGEALLARARDYAPRALIVLSRPSGENHDNSSGEGEFCLTGEERELLHKVGESFADVIVVLNVGYPIETAFLREENIGAALYTGFGGMLGGKAIVDVLCGEENPSGRLTDTWCERYEDNPSAANFYDCRDGRRRFGADEDVWLDTVYEEDIYVGYRYFETFHRNGQVAWPFGYGLSYTDFRTEPEQCAYDRESGLGISFLVKNVGEIPGKEVVQVYLAKPEGTLEKPARELVEFGKTRLLKKGESQKLTFRIPGDRLGAYSTAEAAWLLEAGIYRVYAGENVRDAEEIFRFEVQKTEVLKRVKNRMTPVQDIRVLSQREGDPEKKCRGGASGVKVHALQPVKQQPSYQVPKEHQFRKDGGKQITWQDVRQNAEELEGFVAGMSMEEMARLAVCASHGWGMEGTGEAGRIYALEGLELPDFVVADGNSGVNLKKPNIGMPSGVTICASFNRELAAQVGEVIGEEAKELGISLILAPALNIHRNPLNGRHPEYFSEDPYLAGQMAGYYCRGLEGTGTGGCYKHLIANNAETSRKRNQSVITERAIRKIYFRAFEYALQVHQPVSVMTAYNAVNGIFTSEDSDLIQGLLREECGWQGFVMTDWDSYSTADVVKMQKAGNTWITPGSMDDTYNRRIVEAVKKGELEEDRLRENIYYVLKALLQLESHS